MPTAPLDRQTVLDVDPWLEPQVPAILHRHGLFRKWKDTIMRVTIIREKGHEWKD